MSEGYAITNALAGLAATAFTWSSGYTTGRDRLNDTLQDVLAAGSASAQASGQTLVIDFGSAVRLCGFALLNHNLGTGAVTVRVRSATDATITSNVTTDKAASTINTSAPYHKDTVLQFPAAAPGAERRYWELTFVHSGSKTLSIGEILAFSASGITTLSRATIYGAGESERYVQNRNESNTGSIHATFLSGPIRSKMLPFKDLVGTSQRDELMSMWRATQGGVTSLLYLDLIESTAIAATATAQQCLWGKLQEEYGWTQGDFNLFDVTALKLTGLGREVGS